MNTYLVPVFRTTTEMIEIQADSIEDAKEAAIAAKGYGDQGCNITFGEPEIKE